jgi:hypothetical protein
MPAAVGVMLTEHVADAPVPANVQVPLGVKVTVPVGVVGVVETSVTVAAQLVAWLTNTVDGVHATVVGVAGQLQAIGAVPELVEWVVSPLYVPVIKWDPVTESV